jgi:hypothetical protein
MDTNTPVPSPYTEAAKALLEKIRGLRAEVPHFIHDVPADRRKLIQKYIVPDGFLESAGVSIQTFDRLEKAVGTDAATLRDAFSYALAYDAVVQEAAAFARAVAHTLRVQRAEAGASALDIYAIATRLSKQKDGAELIPYVEDMKKKLAKTKRPRKPNSNPDPAPVAPVTTPSKKE